MIGCEDNELEPVNKVLQTGATRETRLVRERRRMARSQETFSTTTS